jgi:hypothetical protein
MKLATEISNKPIPPEIDYQVQGDNNSIEIYAERKKILEYAFNESQYKSYIKELYTPGGINILLDSPADHIHHHGLMFAIKVDGINFWEETEKSGFQISEKIEEVNMSDGAGVQHGLIWVDFSKQKRLLVEQREIKIQYISQVDANFLTWVSKFNVTESRSFVSLTGSHYHGLGMRFLRSMDKIGSFFTANNRKGKIFRGQERLISDEWCAYGIKSEDLKITVAMFAFPDNPEGPTIWFTMKEPFAYLSATLKLHEKELQLKKSNQLTLIYGIAIWDEFIETSKIAKAYQLWKNLINNSNYK